ncbi:Mur ligase family protein, partial [Acinetobacter baumannii]|nr:Mur ligase family protein [Acinetobacter baumannii]
LCTVKEVAGQKPVFFGLADSNSYYETDIESLGLKGTRCTLHLADGNTVTAQIHIPGHHMVYNALAGAAAGCALGLTPEE